MDEPAVRFEGIERVYPTPTGEVRALRDVTGQVAAGSVTAVVGPSGSGKSSLLKLIAGIDRPTAGRMTVGGRDVGRASARARRHLRHDTVGFVYQRPAANFLPDLTVGEHLRFAAGPGGEPHRLMALLDALGIAHRVDHLPGALSGGEQQRAAFAQALATGAAIVVADEPTAELDSASGAQILDRLRALSARGTTFVIATHDRDVIAASDEQVLLEHGRVRGAAPTAPSGPREDPLATRQLSIAWPHDPGGTFAGDASGPVVRVSGVSKTYGRDEEAVHAVRDVTLSADPGEIVALVGRSGSGKTTLLNLLAGWERPDEGTVEVPGRPEPRWSDVAVLPQRLGLLDELSVLENVRYPARLAGELDAREQLVHDLIQELGLAHLSRRVPRETSLGEQQRAALARALVMEPRVLIADEPTGHQDAGWARAMFLILESASAGGTCCLIATHDRSLMPLVHRVDEMADGRVAVAAG